MTLQNNGDRLLLYDNWTDVKEGLNPDDRKSPTKHISSISSRL